MNPNTTIRPWILACGKQFGVRYAFNYRWPDADNKPNEKFCTYVIKRSIPESDVVLNMDTGDGNDQVQRGSQSCLTTVIIEMYNSQNGLFELNSFCVAAQNHDSLDAFFEDNASIYEWDTEDITDFDDEEINPRQRLTVVFSENVEHVLTNPNGVFDTLRITLDDGTYYNSYDVETVDDDDPTTPGFGPTP